MKNTGNTISLPLAVVMLLIACNRSDVPFSPAENTQASVAEVRALEKAAGQPGNLDFLIACKDQYPYDVRLLEHPVLKARLTKMLDTRYDFLKEIWEVEAPIEIESNMLYAWGMQAHSGGDPGAVLMADLEKDVLYVAIRENEETEVYSEDGSDIPQRMKDWVND